MAAVTLDAAPAAAKPGTGGHVALGTPGASTTFYFAEGTVRDGFVEFLALLNPGPTPAAANVEFAATDDFGTAVDVPPVRLIVGPRARVTANLNDLLARAGVPTPIDLSLRVVSDQPIVVERPLYFAADPGLGVMVDGGTTVVGATTAARAFFFAEGTVRPGFIEYLALQNPGPSPARVTMEFDANDDAGAPVGVPPLTVMTPAGSRTTIDVTRHIVASGVTSPIDVATRVSSDQPVVAERPLYFAADPGLGARVNGGTTVVGATATSTTFLFAEGTVRPGFVEYLVVDNPQAVAALTSLEFFATGDAGVALALPSATVAVPPHGRATVSVNRILASRGISPPIDVSVSLSSPQPVVAERVMYFAADPGVGAPIDGATVAVGATAPSKNLLFAEGTVRPGFLELLTFLNPGPRPTLAHVAFQASDDAGVGLAMPAADVAVPARGRTTFDVNRAVAESRAAGPSNVSLSVTSGEPIVAERVVYFSTDLVQARPGLPVPVSARPCTAPPLHLGLDAYRHFDRLSYLEMGDRVWGETTADPAGTNDDPRHVLRVGPDGRRVLFDQTGPGVVTFMRMQMESGGPWQLSVDGGPPTTVAASDLGQAAPSTFPAVAFPFPLSANPAQTRGSSIVAGAIPFRQSLTWSASGMNGNFYSMYRKLPYGTPVASWSGAEPVDDVASLLRGSALDSVPNGMAGQAGTLTLAPRRETTVTTLTGPSQLRALRFRVPFGEKVRVGNSRLRIYWDDEASPSVDAPLKFLVGDGAGVYQPEGRALVQAWPARAGGDGATFMDFSLFWPMPFRRSARLSLESTTDSLLDDISWSANYEPFLAPPAWWGTFHATYTSVPSPLPGEDMTLLDVAGSGRVVATIVNFGTVGPTLEGDPRFFLDDNRTPQVRATGTEEWGIGGNYWEGGVQTSLALGGHPSGTNNPPGADIDGDALYRFLIADSVPFNRHAVLRWEHGGLNENPQPYRAVVLWYGHPVRTALLTDRLDVGDSVGRSAHGYRSPLARPYVLTAGDEYTVRAAPVTAEGSATTGATSFTMRLEPHNAGAFLRRTFDYGLADQRAEVLIDGMPAGTWYTPGAFDGLDPAGLARRWREEEFPLPASLTAGKSQVVVTLRHVATADPPNTAWTEFGYQMFSFVPADCPVASRP